MALQPIMFPSMEQRVAQLETQAQTFQSMLPPQSGAEVDTKEKERR